MSFLRAPFRILSSPTFNASLYPGSGVALGRHHASWFLVYATRPIMEHKRPALCLNFVVPGDPSFVGALSSAGKPVFTIGGHANASRPVMDALLGLRDEDGCAPVALTERHQVENRQTRRSRPRRSFLFSDCWQSHFSVQLPYYSVLTKLLLISVDFLLISVDFHTESLPTLVFCLLLFT
ncbi:hypothetical protein OH76DRAFT_709790 [Lentinus brumalis]|uniref:Uncharacterized protein n=1 Tax=Lentinus brumalis TaxID=2498619 RepID=A0A371D5A9_9APHY|nr:hypothetical protein OH76DRAFT_709790 [Polyporus brumalis]